MIRLISNLNVKIILKIDLASLTISFLCEYSLINAAKWKKTQFRNRMFQINLYISKFSWDSLPWLYKSRPCCTLYSLGRWHIEEGGVHNVMQFVAAAFQVIKLPRSYKILAIHKTKTIFNDHLIAFSANKSPASRTLCSWNCWI